MLPVSVLDLAPIVVGGTPAQALRNSLDLAQHAEKLGYNRYWVAEHHNLSGIASAATSVVIAHIGQGTEKIRVGAASSFRRRLFDWMFLSCSARIRRWPSRRSAMSASSAEG